MSGDVGSKLAAIRAVFDEPGLGRHISAIQADAGRRVVSSRLPDRVVKASKFKRGKRSGNPLTPIEGSIIMFWARPGSDIIPRLEQAYAKGDEATLNEVQTLIARQSEDEPVPTLDAAADAVLASPMHFNVRYGTKVLSRTLTLPEGADVCLVAFPYNGGDVKVQDFAIDQYHQAGETVEYPTLVVITPPLLSEVEKRALEAVPADQISVNIGEASFCPAATAIVLILVALATHAGIWREMDEQMNEVHLSADQIDRLGPMASARELVAMRREVFEAHGF